MMCLCIVYKQLSVFTKMYKCALLHVCDLRVNSTKHSRVFGGFFCFLICCFGVEWCFWGGGDEVVLVLFGWVFWGFLFVCVWSFFNGKKLQILGKMYLCGGVCSVLVILMICLYICNTDSRFSIVVLIIKCPYL